MAKKVAKETKEAEAEVTATAQARRPLADRLRPTSWEAFRGLESLDKHLIASLRRGQGVPPSLLLWGPPGCGKTTLARLIGGSYNCNFVECSAVLVGVKEIREIAAAAKEKEIQTILFIDEIHRLNKGQQDAFLPHVENGTFVLVGATTENPSFYLTSALLSRLRVVVLGAVAEGALQEIAEAAAGALALKLADGAFKVLLNFAAGDARRLLNLLEGYREATVNLAEGSGAVTQVSQEELEEFLQDAKVAFYDRDGEEHYNIISAFIKSLRGSNPDAALYWCFRMLGAGEDPRFVIRRMICFAAEDISNADPRALSLAVATADAFDRIGMPEGKIPIAQCVTYLASAPKSNRSYLAMHKAIAAVERNPNGSVPLHLRNAPTGLMKSLGYGIDYKYPHDCEYGFAAGVEYLPEEIRGQVFYEPSDYGAEKVIKERLTFFKNINAKKKS